MYLGSFRLIMCARFRSSFWLACLPLVIVLKDVSSVSNQTRRAHPGDNNVILFCVGDVNKSTLGVHWVKDDDQKHHVYHCVKGEAPDREQQDPSFVERAELVDPQMENDNLSLRINNITLNDTGYYKCCFLQQRSKRSDSFCTEPHVTWFLNVSAPTAGGEEGNRPDEHHKDGRNKSGGSANGTNKDLSNKDGGNSIGLQTLTGLTAGVAAIVVFVVFVVLLFLSLENIRQPDKQSRVQTKLPLMK